MPHVGCQTNLLCLELPKGEKLVPLFELFVRARRFILGGQQRHPQASRRLDLTNDYGATTVDAGSCRTIVA